MFPIYKNEKTQKKPQKNFTVKNVTSLLTIKKILIVIYPLQNIKWKRMETFWKPKKPRLFVSVERLTRYRSGLFKHKKKCPSIVEKPNVSKNPKTKLIKSTNVDEQFINVDDQLKILEKKTRLAELNLKIAEINQGQNCKSDD